MGVEPEGFEPSSKQGIHMLSTCLVLFDCGEIAGIRPTYYNLIPLISLSYRDLNLAISTFTIPHWDAVEKSFPGSSKRLISKIKQLTRSYFRQLDDWELIFSSHIHNARHAYTPIALAVKTCQPHIYCKFTILNWRLKIIRTQSADRQGILFIYYQKSYIWN